MYTQITKKTLLENVGDCKISRMHNAPYLEDVEWVQGLLKEQLRDGLNWDVDTVWAEHDAALCLLLPRQSRERVQLGGRVLPRKGGTRT